MHTFSPKGTIFGPILPQFILERVMSLGAKVTYTVLCNYAATKDHCWPSQETLAKRVGCSLSSIKNYLQELVTQGLIAIIREKHRSSVYYMLLPQEFMQGNQTSVKSDIALPQTNFENVKANFTDAYVDSDVAQSDFAEAQLNFVKTEVNFAEIQPNSDHINNLNKQINQTTHPLPPAELEVSKHNVASEMALVGGVFPLANDFLKLWELYPKKEGKGLARMAWVKLLQQDLLPPLGILTQAIERFATSESWQRENGRFIPQLSNWLRGERWLDEGIAPSLQEQKKSEEQEKARLFQQMLQKQEEAEQQKASEKREALRPSFEAFEQKFPQTLKSNNMSMVFAAWRHLHAKGVAPSASDVPGNIAVNIMDFMKNYQRQQAIRSYQQDNAKQYVMSSMYSPPTVEYTLPSDNVTLQKAV